MDVAAVRGFFMWCTVINGGMLVFSSVMCILAGNWVYQVQRKWFPISREAFNIVIYCFLGLFKIFFLTLSLVPYIALVIIG